MSTDSSRQGTETQGLPASRDEPGPKPSTAALMVELIMQHPEPDQTAAYRLERTQHRVAAGTTIRQLLQAGQADLIPAIEAKALGLSRFGRRAWLDDPLRPDDRVEVLCPILADAKAARFARVAKARAERTDGRWGKSEQVRAAVASP